jgi:histone deacetylase 11
LSIAWSSTSPGDITTPAQNGGEGFSIYSDIALAILSLRKADLLGKDEHVIYVDCDVHQGNGVCHAFFNDPSVFIYDCFNPRIYPAFDIKARRRIDCAATLPMKCGDQSYLEILEKTLVPFLDALGKSSAIRFAIYNAGTDVFAGDPLGRIEVTAEGVLKRDRFVIDELLRRGTNVLVLPSGGYTRESYRLISNTISHYIENDSLKD